MKRTSNPRPSTIGNLLAFARTGRRAWMLPIIVLLVLVSVLAFVGALAPYAAFIYPL